MDAKTIKLTDERFRRCHECRCFDVMGIQFPGIGDTDGRYLGGSIICQSCIEKALELIKEGK